MEKVNFIATCPIPPDAPSVGILMRNNKDVRLVFSVFVRRGEDVQMIVASAADPITVRGLLVALIELMEKKSAHTSALAGTISSDLYACVSTAVEAMKNCCEI